MWDSGKCPWLWQEGWNSMTFKVPSNQNILLFYDLTSPKFSLISPKCYMSQPFLPAPS